MRAGLEGAGVLSLVKPTPYDVSNDTNSGGNVTRFCFIFHKYLLSISLLKSRVMFFRCMSVSSFVVLGMKCCWGQLDLASDIGYDVSKNYI